MSLWMPVRLVMPFAGSTFHLLTFTVWNLSIGLSATLFNCSFPMIVRRGSTNMSTINACWRATDLLVMTWRRQQTDSSFTLVERLKKLPATWGRMKLHSRIFFVNVSHCPTAPVSTFPVILRLFVHQVWSADIRVNWVTESNLGEVILALDTVL